MPKIIQLFQIIGVEISNQIPNNIGLVRSTTILHRIIWFLLSYLNLSIPAQPWGLKSTSPNLPIKKTTKWRILTGSCGKIISSIVILLFYGLINQTWIKGWVILVLHGIALERLSHVLNWNDSYSSPERIIHYGLATSPPPNTHTHTPIPRVNVDLFSKFLWNGHQTLWNHNIDNNNEGFIYEGVAVNGK